MFISAHRIIPILVRWLADEERDEREYESSSRGLNGEQSRSLKDRRSIVRPLVGYFGSISDRNSILVLYIWTFVVKRAPTKGH
jgi:hypothetical protein